MVLKTRFETLNWWNSTSGGRRSNGFHFWGFALTPAANFEPALVGQLRLLTSFDNFVLYIKRPGSTMQCSSIKGLLAIWAFLAFGLLCAFKCTYALVFFQQQNPRTYVVLWSPAFVFHNPQHLCSVYYDQLASVLCPPNLLSHAIVSGHRATLSYFTRKKEGDQLSQDLEQWCRWANTRYKTQWCRCARASMTVPATISYFLVGRIRSAVAQ